MSQATRGFAQFADEIVERGRSDGAFAGDFLYIIGAQIGDHDLVTAAHEAARHIGAHLAQTDHSYPHNWLLASILNRFYSSQWNIPECEYVCPQALKRTPKTNLTQRLSALQDPENQSLQLSASRNAAANVARPAFKSLPRWTRNARRPRSASTWKSPRAWAALTMPKVYFCPGTGKIDGIIAGELQKDA